MGRFIDVSEHNTVDWAKAKSAVDYAYLRCGVRGSLAKMYPESYKKIRFDKKWKANLTGVRKNKIPYGAYYFPTAITDAEALEGAKWFYEQVKDLDMSLPPMLDSENVWGRDREPGRANSLSKSERTRLLKIVTDYFNARGLNIGIYASASWFTSKLDMSKFPRCVIDCTWVADSTGAVDYNGYYWLHQYGKGSCTGCSGDVDLNRIITKIPSVKISEKKQDNPIDIAIQIAEGEIGYHEGANNWTKYGDEMHALQPRNMDRNAPWCDCWVDWVIYKTCQRFGYGADKARAVLCGDFDDYTYASVALYKKAGRWTKTPHRGDQIFFGGSGHTGIVTSVSGGVVHTIEGNKSDQVKVCSYSTSSPSIIGYGRPRYELISGTASTVITETEEYDMPTIKRGSQGKAVKVLQVILGGLDPDGSYGPLTEEAVIAFQKKAFPNDKSEWDGIVGPKTWKKLLATL